MALINRKALKKYFRRGNSPQETHFADLIDSTFNKVDDTINMSKEKGLELKSLNEAGNLLSFYRDELQNGPAWQFAINPKNHEPPSFSIKAAKGQTQFCLHPNGNSGVLTENPQLPFQVEGFMGSSGRIGLLAVGTIPGDGKWHPILKNLTQPAALEVVAKAQGAKGRGKYALLHAIAMGTFGHSKHNKINQTCSYFGWFWNKIKLRWKGDAHTYQLEMSTRGHYGLDEAENPFPVYFHISSLWDDDLIKQVLAAQTIPA